MKLYDIGQEDIKKSITEFSSLHEFFIRELRRDARPVHLAKETLVSPVDGVIENIGVITKDLIMVVKNKNYSVEEMVGDLEKAKHYEGGTFMVIYLSPAHYHRIHSPISATIVDQQILGRHSYPVNAAGLKYGEQVLSKNYRHVVELEKNSKKMSMAMVGAMWVNSIERTQKKEQWEKGEEVAYFTFGSTVVLLFEKNTFVPMIDTTPFSIRVGEKLGQFRS